MAKKGMSIGKSAMWVLMGLLAFSLVGFGATNLSGTIRTIGNVGDKSVSVDVYARQLQNEIQALSQQTGQPLPFAQVQAIGLDTAVLQRLVRNRGLDHEATEMGLSVGDEVVRDEILRIPAFQGVDGEFDREGYRFALERSGLSEGEFETNLREEAARSLLQGAILGGVRMPEAYAETLVNYVGEQRSFTWSLLDASDLTTPVPAPTTEQLRSFYDENTDQFMLPATKVITYVLLSPDQLMDDVEVPEEELRAEYEARSEQYNQPERRLVERLVFADPDAADQAAAALEAGDTRFRTLVEDRGLALADVDMGDVSRQDLDDAGEAVFAAETGSVVGPLPSSLGPALFRVNAVLPAQNTTFEEAREELRAEVAVSRAVRAVEARALDIDDQLAGGATLEQLAEETEMRLSTIAWHPEAQDTIAGYEDFRRAARAIQQSDFPKIEQLDDGGIFAMRLDEQRAAQPNPFEDALFDIRPAWEAAQTVTLLEARAAEIVTTFATDGTLEAAGLDAIVETDQTRDAFINGAPSGFVSEIFDLSQGETKVLPGDQTVAIVTLDAITPAPNNAEKTALLDELGAQINQALAQDLFQIFADDVVRRAGPEIDQRALQAVHVNFP